MALDDLKGTVINNTVLASLNQASVAQALIGSEVDGNAVVGRGKTLRVAKTTALTVSDYDGTTPISPASLTPGYVDLTLDQAKHVAITLDDVDEALLSVEILSPYAIEAGNAMAAEIDGDIIAALDDDATSLGAKALDSTYSAYELLTDLSVALDEANVSASGRWVLVTPAFAGRLALDGRLNRATAAGDQVAISGFVGEAAGFRVVKSNHVPAGTVLAGHPSAAAFAQAVAKTEAFRSPDFFAIVWRTLSVYGVKVLREEALVKATFTVSGS